MYLESHKKKECCGCGACSHICPKHAIKMLEDKQGFFYPVIDETLCVQCDKCKKVCPMEVNYVGQDADPVIFAVQNKDPKELFDSSSGGTFSLLAKWILERGGCVYGAKFSEDYSVIHCRATTLEEIKAFRTSKYVESDFERIFEEVLEDLKDKRPVLVSGTPCQISAMNRFLEAKHVDLTEYYSCDVICHGVPSRKLWKDYLETIQKKYLKKGEKILSVNMRSKKESWEKQVIDIRAEKTDLEDVLSKFSFNQFYLSLFGNKPSCFQCHYTSYKRSGDFSLADFWNVNEAHLSFSPNGGINEVFLNTEKAKHIFDLISSKTQFCQIDKKTAWQPHLEMSAKEPPKREEFWKEYSDSNDKEKVMQKYSKGSFLRNIIKLLSPVLRKIGLYTLFGKLYKIVFIKER